MRSRPKVLRLALTNRCNSACVFCRDSRGLEQVWMSLDDFSNILDRSGGAVEMVDFAFYGEPMLHPDLFQMIEMVRSRGIATLLNTNGTLITEKNCAQLADAGLDMVVINMNAWIGGNYLESAADLPLSRVSIINQLLEATRRSRTLTVLQVVAKNGRAGFDQRELAGRFTQSSNLVFRVKAEEAYLYDGNVRLPGPLRCHRLFQELVVGPTGDVLLCCCDVEMRITLGNLLKDDLDTIWLRNLDPIRRKNDLPLCHQCDIRGGRDKLLANALLSPAGAMRLYFRTLARL